ncbi:MAG: GtrA family protein [Clostridia bacterium]|nr:GtrA family protein [Clostridia bacterium]
MENENKNLNEPAEEEAAASATAVLTSDGEESTNEDAVSATEDTPKKLTKKQQFIQILKFTGFSISAGVIQLVSFGVLYDWTSLLPWWPAYLISVILSVIWNFTFNRKFTFAAANNVPLAMGLVIVYYCAFIPLSVFGGDAIAAQLPPELGMLVTFMMMLVNFVTEFIWDKLIVFNQKVTDKLLGLFKKNK